MTNLNPSKITLFIFVPILLFASCKKPKDGAVGPQGPAGANGQNGTNGITHYIGELYGGGIVAYVWKDATGEHGIISCLYDQSAGSVYSNVSTLIGASAQSSYDGKTNTSAIINQPGHTASAAKLCDTLNTGGFSDWYLPAIWELQKLNEAAFQINSILDTDASANTKGFIAGSFDSYWSSTEDNALNGGWHQFFGTAGSSAQPNKQYSTRVRAVRSY